MKTKDCYTELSVQLARVESKLDYLIDKLITKETTVTVTDIINTVGVPPYYKVEFKPKDLDQIK